MCHSFPPRSTSAVPYFSPISRENETHKRITLMMERVSEESKAIIKNIFVGQQIEEINARDANELLLRCSPPRTISPSGGNGRNNGLDSDSMLDVTEIRRILVYPPGTGGMSINTQDYMCLAIDQYLNDIIIDFYLKYLRLELLNEEERKSVHIFSTFFYNRLTMAPARQRGSASGATNGDKDVRQTAAQKRHARVASWTKRENIFERQFVVIPINEQSHWFLAIICFPGLDGPVTMTSNTPAQIRKSTSATTTTTSTTTAASPSAKSTSSMKSVKSSTNMTLQIGNTTITPVSKRELESITLGGDDECERDEAEGDESELASEAEEAEDEEPTDVRPAIKQ